MTEDHQCEVVPRINHSFVFATSFYHAIMAMRFGLPVTDAGARVERRCCVPCLVSSPPMGMPGKTYRSFAESGKIAAVAAGIEYAGGGMVEQVDTLALGASSCKAVGVQVPFPPPALRKSMNEEIERFISASLYLCVSTGDSEKLALLPCQFPSDLCYTSLVRR